MKYTISEPVYTDEKFIAGSKFVRELAIRLKTNYLTLCSSLYFTKKFLPSIELRTDEIDEFINMTIVRKDTNQKHGFDARFYIGEIQSEDTMNSFIKTYLADSLIILADALNDYDYFGNDPSLEIVYHLRNGIAHGNIFNITKSGINRLKKFPAHTRDSWRRGGDKVDFEIDIKLNGKPILFDYMYPGDIIDIFDEVATCLQKKSTGLPVFPK